MVDVVVGGGWWVVGVWWWVVGGGWLVCGGGWLVVVGGWLVVCGGVLRGEKNVMKNFFWLKQIFATQLFWGKQSFVIHFFLFDNKFIYNEKIKKIKLRPFFFKCHKTLVTTKNCQEENLEDLKTKQKNNSVCVTKNDDTFSLKSKNIGDI